MSDIAAILLTAGVIGSIMGLAWHLTSQYNEHRFYDDDEFDE